MRSTPTRMHGMARYFVKLLELLETICLSAMLSYINSAVISRSKIIFLLQRAKSKRRYVLLFTYERIYPVDY